MTAAEELWGVPPGSLHGCLPSRLWRRGSAGGIATEAPEVGASERMGVVAVEEAARALEVREPPLLACQMERERRLDHGPAHLDEPELLLRDLAVLLADGFGDLLASGLELLDLLPDLFGLLLVGVAHFRKRLNVDEDGRHLLDLGGELLEHLVRLDLRGCRLLVLLVGLLLRIVQTRDVGEPERRKRERLERIHSYDFVAHGPLLLPPFGAFGC